MTNQELSKIFNNIALYFEMDGVPFKPQAYEKAAINVEALPESVENIYKKGGSKAFEEIPGIGKNIADKIVEYIKTGKIKEYEKLKKKTPVNIEELISVEGIGPKGVKYLYKTLKIKNLKDLERAAKAGKIRNLPNFGEKKEQNILEGIEFVKRSRGRFLLGEILPKVCEILGNLKKLKEVKQISEAGSIRRRKETIGDVDVLVTSSNPKKVVEYFVSTPGVVKIWGKGPTKASVRLSLGDGFDPVRGRSPQGGRSRASGGAASNGVDVDLRVLPDKQFGSALQYFTGSKEHNIVLRKIAINKKLKLSEYGLFSGAKMVAGKTEKEIYKALKMNYIEPELRENTGEIEAALRSFNKFRIAPNKIEGRQVQSKLNGLPKIIGIKDIKGDLHVHSNWNGGENSIEELAKEAMRMGYEYIGISDHTKFLRIENGLDEKQLIERNSQIDKLNKKFQASGFKFRVLKGCEANIMADGSIDIKDETLKKLDYVIAGVHSQMKMSKVEMTKRIILAMKNLNVDIIAHPTGRILKKRDEYEVDFDELLRAAKETGTILEINAFPVRLDLNDVHIKKAKQAGVKMVINTDSHKKEHFGLMGYGISQARRGWAEKNDIINCWPAEKLLKLLK